jgi:hypothetical protein
MGNVMNGVRALEVAQFTFVPAASEAAKAKGAIA